MSLRGNYICQSLGGGCPGSSDRKQPSCNVGDLGLIPQSGRSPGEGKGYPPQFSGLEDSMDRAAWQVTVPGVTEADTTLSLFHFHFPWWLSG